MEGDQVLFQEVLGYADLEIFREVEEDPYTLHKFEWAIEDFSIFIPKD